METINGLVAKGMQFTYATARSLVSASVVAKGLSTTIPVIAYNGALIIHPVSLYIAARTLPTGIFSGDHAEEGFQGGGDQKAKGNMAL